jgi:hypothetical protein
MVDVDFVCPPQYQAGKGGVCVPVQKPIRPTDLPKDEREILEVGCPWKLPLYPAVLNVTGNHKIAGKLCASGQHFIPDMVLEVGSLSVKAGDLVKSALALGTSNENTICLCTSASSNITAAEEAAVVCRKLPIWKEKQTTWRGEAAYKAAKEVVEYPQNFDLTEKDVAPFKAYFNGPFPPNGSNNNGHGHDHGHGHGHSHNNHHAATGHEKAARGHPAKGR